MAVANEVGALVHFSNISYHNGMNLFNQFVIIILRLVVFIVFWFVVIEFWIFPNMFNEELGVVDSFKPLYSWKKGVYSTTMMACRVFCAILLSGRSTVHVASIYELGKTHSVSDIGRFAKQSFIDVVDWGYEKLTACNTKHLIQYPRKIHTNI